MSLCESKRDTYEWSNPGMLRKDIEWKPLKYNGINYCDRFLISNYGDLYSLKTKKILKKHIHKNGYYQICVSLGSKKDKMVIKLHIAVAQNFVDGYKKGLVVNHKDLNKLRNYYLNLEWVTVGENTRHANENGIYSKSVSIKCDETGQVFPTIKAANLWCGLSYKSSSIHEYIKGRGLSAGKHPETKEKLHWTRVV